MIRSVQLAKRAIDLVGSTVGLVLLGPLVPVLAACVYLDDPGPIFYRQRRAGILKGFEDKDGYTFPIFEEFDMFKFRSMRVDAEKFTGAVLASEDDPRITRVGKVLRKTRLDELPQLFNIWKGEMSLVGPRPERPELLVNLAMAIPFFEERMRDVKPGITGLSQVTLGYTGEIPPNSEIAKLASTLQNPYGLEETRGNLADDMRIKLLYDLAYTASLEKLSEYLQTELKIIFQTPLVMLKMASGR